MDILAFFIKVTGLTPTEDQSKFLLALVDLDIKYIAASAGRQCGKSLCTAVAVLYWAIEYGEPVEIMLLSPMDAYVYDAIERIFTNNPDLQKQIKTEGVTGLVPIKGFELLNGSRVHVRRGTEKQVRGLGVDIAIADEAAELPDKMLTTALGNVRGKISKFIMLSTPHKTGLFTKIVDKPESFNFIIFHWSELNCDWHSKDSLTLKKKTMSNQDYKMEVLGQVLSSEERAYFPPKHIDKCTYEIVTREGKPASVIEAGIDFACSPCRTVLIVSERIFGRVKVLFVKSWGKRSIEEIAPEIAKFLLEFKPSIIKADSMPPEYKGKIEPYIKGYRINYINSVYTKELLLGQLLRLIRTNSLEIQGNQVELLKQLKQYRRGLRTGDDYVDALAFSVYQPAIPFNNESSGGAFFF